MVKRQKAVPSAFADGNGLFIIFLHSSGQASSVTPERHQVKFPVSYYSQPRKMSRHIVGYIVISKKVRGMKIVPLLLPGGGQSLARFFQLRDL